VKACSSLLILGFRDLRPCDPCGFVPRMPCRHGRADPPRSEAYTPNRLVRCSKFAKHVARPAITPKYRGLMTARCFLAITQTGQSIKLVPIGTLPQSNQHLWVLDHADGFDGVCLSALPLSFIEKCVTMPGRRYWTSGYSSVARSSLFCTVAPAVLLLRLPGCRSHRSGAASRCPSWARRGRAEDSVLSATIEVNKHASRQRSSRARSARTEPPVTAGGG
jgi:hypothetical protein